MHSTPLELLILGGQGALASAEFHLRLVKQLSLSAPSADDEAYPRIVHWSEALPGLTPQGLVDVDLAKTALTHRLKSLPFVRPPLVVMPCNSLEPIARELNSQVSVLHALDPTQALIQEALTPWSLAHDWIALRQQPVLVMSSRSHQNGLREGLRGLVSPPSNLLLSDALAQAVSDAVIEQVLAGNLEHAQRQLAAFLDEKAGQTHVLLACTELSVAQPLDRFPHVTDAMDLLVQFVARRLRARAC